MLLQDINCYIDYLFSSSGLPEDQILMLLWEAIIETSDTTLVTYEWAMYELAKDKSRQVYLFLTLLLLTKKILVPQYSLNPHYICITGEAVS